MDFSSSENNMGNPFDSKSYVTNKRNNGTTSPVPGMSMFDMDAFEAALRERGILKELNRTFNLIAVPLLIIAVIGVGFILVWAEEILVPFVVALFFTYLLKPLVNLLSQPWGSCTEARCFNFFDPNSCRRRAPSAAYGGGLNPRKDSGELSAFEQHGSVAFPGEMPETSTTEETEFANLIGEDLQAGATSSPELRSRGLGGIRATTSLGSGPSASTSSRELQKGVCRRCRHARCPRWFAILLCMMFVVGMIAGMVVLIADAIQTFEDEDIDQFEEKTVELAMGMKNWVRRMFGIDMAYMLSQFRKEFHWVSLTKALVIGVLNGLEYVFIIFLFVLYMLFEDPDVGPQHEAGVSRSHSHARDLRRQIDMQIQRYIVIKTLISLAVGFSVYVVLGPILGVKMAHIFGVITFGANFIPNIGALIATILPFPFVVLDPNQTTISMILAFALPVFIHSIVGNVIEPKIFGDTMELHPVVVLISLSFWYTVWGIAGAILSVPITAVMRIVFSHINHPYATVLLYLLEGKLPGSAAFHAKG